MIVVTGMHRSGTSMTLSLLSALGAPFGEASDMISADYWNQSGYFEHREAVSINLRLLLGLGIDVDNWIYPPANPAARFLSLFTMGKWRYLLPSSAAAVEKRAVALTPEMEEFGRRFFREFVKDPRFAVTYKYWHDRVPIVGTVFCFRHPLAVQRSIAKRDLAPRLLVERMWLQHNSGFVSALNGDEPVLLVDYDRFFSPEAPDYINRLGKFVAGYIKERPDVDAALAKIDLSQRHHRTEDATIANAKADAVYRALKTVSARQDEATPAAALREKLRAAGAT